MITLYTIFLIVGLTVFLLALLGNVEHDLGHIFDITHHDFDHAHGDSPSLFSIRTISAFLAAFGVSGLTAISLHWGIPGQLAIGFGSGIVLAAVAYGIMYIFYSQQGWKLTDSRNFVGMQAVITTAPGSQGVGECKIDNKYYSCKEKTNQHLLFNDTVKIVESVEGMLIVEKN